MKDVIGYQEPEKRKSRIEMLSRKIIIKIPHTRWSFKINNHAYLALVMFIPIIGTLLLTSVIGFSAMYLVGLVVLSFILVLGVDIVNDRDEN
jgi:hypothetical protein